MDAVPADDDDPFESQRERVSNPMRRLFSTYGRENIPAIAVGVISSIAARVLDLLPPVLLAVAVDAIFLDERTFSLWFVPAAWIPTDQVGQLYISVALIAGAFFGAAGFHWTRNWGWNAFAQRVQHAVRTDTYNEMQRLSLSFFADKQTGEMMSILSNDVNRLERFLNDGMNSAFRLGVMVIGIAAILLYWNWQLALVTLSVVPLIGYFTYRFVKIIQPKYADVRSSVGQLNSRLENNLGGIQVIKSAHTENFESDRVDDTSQEYFDSNWDAIKTRITFFPALRILSGVGFVLTFLIGGAWVLTYQQTGQAPLFFSGSLTPGEFVGFILFTQRFIWPMSQFGQIINMYQRAYASAARIFGLMDEPARIVNDPDAPALDVDTGTVQYSDVTFGYETDEEPTIKDISFEIPGGETLALVGPTGAGKSTVLKLLLRMYDVDEGAITVDGTDVREITIPSLRESIGYVSQDTFMFYGTVAENIRYGTFNASRDEIIDAAKTAEAHEFIMNLPDGYDTEIGERGVKLSGGQRQRLSIARAVLRDPEILILDEATSDVDTETEMLIKRSIDRLTADRTTFSIAHRLSTIKDADRILVLDDGEIVERGTHTELLAADGLYAHLWGVQAGEIEELPETFIQRATQRASQTSIETDTADD
jgi:ATP-binding cassette subfamily B protein